MLTITIDVNLLDKARFKRITRKNGKEAVFCDLVLFEQKSEWGDYIVKQQVSKEERLAKLSMPIVGNAKSYGPRSPSDRSPEPKEETAGGGDEGRVPF